MQVSMNDNKEQKIRRRGWSDSSPDIYPVDRHSLTNNHKNAQTVWWKIPQLTNCPLDIGRRQVRLTNLKSPQKTNIKIKLAWRRWMTDDMTWQQDTTNPHKGASREAAASNAQCNKKPSNFLQPNTVKVKRNQLSKSHIIMLIHKKVNIIASVVFISDSSNSMRVQHCSPTKMIRKSSWWWHPHNEENPFHTSGTGISSMHRRHLQ